MFLGDNLILEDLSSHLNTFMLKPEGTCQLFLKIIDNPIAFGVAEIGDGRIVNIIEKPQKPPSNYAVIGVYLYDHHVFEIIDNLQPSARGEYEITDVNMVYVRKNQATYAVIDSIWLDTGSIQTLFEASQYMAQLRGNLTNP